ncbi:MAG: DUF4292 domain-containing protein [Cytophagales bacterium]|nr:DUF4292 domain-containing protein [Cytophagales bacterium]
MNKLVILLMGVLFLSSCGNRLSRSKQNLLEINNIDFHSFKTKAKIKYKDSEQSLPSVTTTIRMRKDSIIWMSAKAMGFEVGRIRMMQDSVYLLNKWQKEYYVKDYQSLSKMMNFPVDFQLIQATLLGNQAFTEIGAQKLKKEENHYLLINKISQFIISQYVNKESMRIQDVKVEQQEANGELTIAYRDFITIQDKPLASNIQVNVSYQDTTQTSPFESSITFKYYKSEFTSNPLKYPFHVSKKYKKK